MKNDKGACGSTTARKQLRLLIARGELAEARAERMMRSCAAEAADVRRSSTDQVLLDRHAWRTSTLLKAERMLQSPLAAEVDLGATFEKFATYFLLGSEFMTELHTSYGSVIVSGEVCRWVMLVAAELLHVVESGADPMSGCKGRITIDHIEQGLVLSVVGTGAGARPVPSCSGAAALARTTRVMTLFGGLETSVREGDMVYEATFNGGRVAVSS